MVGFALHNADTCFFTTSGMFRCVGNILLESIFTFVRPVYLVGFRITTKANINVYPHEHGCNHLNLFCDPPIPWYIPYHRSPCPEPTGSAGGAGSPQRNQIHYCPCIPFWIGVVVLLDGPGVFDICRCSSICAFCRFMNAACSLALL